MVENFAQLKRQVVPGVELEIVGYWLPRYIGQVRRITRVTRDGFYMAIPCRPEHVDSRDNDALSDLFWWRTDSFWEFKDGVISHYFSIDHHDEEHLVVAFKLKEAEGHDKKLDTAQAEAYRGRGI